MTKQAHNKRFLNKIGVGLMLFAATCFAYEIIAEVFELTFRFPGFGMYVMVGIIGIIGFALWQR